MLTPQLHPYAEPEPDAYPYSSEPVAPAGSLRTGIITASGVAVPVGLVLTATTVWPGLVVLLVALVGLYVATRTHPYTTRSDWWGQWWPSVLGWTLMWGVVLGLVALAVLAFKFLAGIAALALICSAIIQAKRLF